MKNSRIIFGTSALGNLYTAIPFNDKKAILEECLRHAVKPVIFDSAGKYGAGLALEVLGRCLKELNVPKGDVIISNKLGWYRTPLKTPEPTFERGVWKEIDYDAAQHISYEGIMECYKQGNVLLNGYLPQWVSVHDPDEYLAAAGDEQTREMRYKDLLAAYKALAELKRMGKVSRIGIGAKDWRVIKRLHQDIELDWVMFANSITIMKHPKEVLDFVKVLHEEGVEVINSAIFHSGFLVGTDYFDYRLVTETTDKELFQWRDQFIEVCDIFGVRPAEACVQFALNIAGIDKIALNTTKPDRVSRNISMVSADIPDKFWDAMKTRGLISSYYPFR